MSNGNELKPWVKFKHWLIKKLGGHVHKEVVEVRYVERLPLTLVAERKVSLDSLEWDRERIESLIKKDLACEIAKELLERDLLEIEEAENPIYRVTRYRAKIAVYAKKGADNERRKAD